MFRTQPMPSSEIIEISAINSMLKRRLISHDTWIFLDLDNTVFEAVSALGGDPFFSGVLNIIKEQLKKEATAEDALVLTLSICHAVQQHTKVKPVENDIVTLVNRLQEIGIPVIGLTARDNHIITRTTQQLTDIGIDFTRSLGNIKCASRAARELHGEGRTPIIFENGVIFCGDHNKGIGLNAFMKAFKVTPNHVIFVDDKKHHLTCVEEVAKNHKIRFHGLRYGYLDEKVNSYDMQQALSELAPVADKLPVEVQGHLTRFNLHRRHHHHHHAHDHHHHHHHHHIVSSHK